MDTMDKNQKDPLKALLNKSLLEDAPNNIVEQVLAKSGIQKTAGAPAYQPVISKITWWFIGIITAITFLAILYSNAPGNHVLFFRQIGFQMPKLHIPVINWDMLMPSLSIDIGFMAIIFSSMAIVMVVDKFFRQTDLKRA
jgi:hypothetical protein